MSTGSDAGGDGDLLVESYTHPHVESARTCYTRAEDGETVNREPRAVVVDEFPGLAHAEEFGEAALDHTRWLAGAVREDVRDFTDLHEADLTGDTFLAAWLDGEAAAAARGDRGRGRTPRMTGFAAAARRCRERCERGYTRDRPST